MVGNFNTTFTMELKLKLTELNHFVEIYAECHLTDKLSNYNLILGWDILCKLAIIFKFKNKTITWQEVSISMKPLNCTTKEFFVIKESRPIRNVTKRIKQILDAEYKTINLKSIIINSNYLKHKHKIFSLELLQKYEVRNATKRIKQILDAEYKKINLKSIIMNLNYLKDKQEDSLLELLQKCEKMLDGTLGKYTGSDYMIE